MDYSANTKPGAGTLPSGGPHLVRNDELTILRLSGRDPSGMLDAISTNKLPGSESSIRTLLLDAKGRIQSDLLVLRDGADLLVVVNEPGLEAARTIIGRYAPFSKVKLEETDLTVLTLHDSDASLTDDLSSIVLVSGDPASGVSYLVTEESTEDSVVNSLNEAGVSTVSEEAGESARIEAGVPRFGEDFTPENFPGELGAAFLDSRVSFEKGCYPGQETVARMHYRGQPNKRLHRFVVEGDARHGAEILQNEKVVGIITSVAPLPVEGMTYALGFLKRRAEPSGELVTGEATLKIPEPESDAPGR